MLTDRSYILRAMRSGNVGSREQIARQHSHRAFEAERRGHWPSVRLWTSRGEVDENIDLLVRMQEDMRVGIDEAWHHDFTS